MRFRVVEITPTDEDLQLRFDADPLKSGPKRLAFEDSQRLFSAWVENLEQQLGLQWEANTGPFN